MAILRPVQKFGVLGEIAPGAGRKNLGFYLGFKGGELGGVRVVVAFYYDKVFSSRKLYIYIIYTPNLGSRITLPGRGREQGCFRGSTKGAMSEHRGTTEGARGSTGGAEREHEAVQGRSRWEPEVDFLYLGLSCL